MSHLASDVFPINIWIKIASCDFDIWQTLIKTSSEIWRYARLNSTLLWKSFGNVKIFENIAKWKISKHFYRENDLPHHISDHDIEWKGEPGDESSIILRESKTTKTKREHEKKPRYICYDKYLFYSRRDVRELAHDGGYKILPLPESNINNYYHYPGSEFIIRRMDGGLIEVRRVSVWWFREDCYGYFMYNMGDYRRGKPNKISETGNMQLTDLFLDETGEWRGV